MKIVLLLTILLLPFVLAAQDIRFPPVPEEDTVNGRNDNCYLGAVNHPTDTEKTAFIILLQPYIDSLCRVQKLPAKTVMAMAILESGFGFTRTGYYANNLFGIKVFTTDTSNAYALKGQPDENNGRYIHILKTTRNGGLIFDEGIRTDNRYIKFESKQACIYYLVTNLLQKPRYKQAALNYIKNTGNNIPGTEAALIYAFEIADKGYNHHGGNYYRNAINKIITQYRL